MVKGSEMEIEKARGKEMAKTREWEMEMVKG